MFNFPGYDKFGCQVVPVCRSYLCIVNGFLNRNMNADGRFGVNGETGL